MNIKNVIVGAVLLVVGLLTILWVAGQDCELGTIKQKIVQSGQTIDTEIDYPPKLEKAICMTQTTKLAIPNLFGALFLFVGGSMFIKGIFTDKCKTKC